MGGIDRFIRRRYPAWLQDVRCGVWEVECGEVLSGRSALIARAIKEMLRSSWLRYPGIMGELPPSQTTA